MLAVTEYEPATDTPAFAIVTDGTNTARLGVWEGGDPTGFWAPFTSEVDDNTIPDWIADAQLPELDAVVLAAAQAARRRS
jgi:hypothetical protein